VGPWVVIVIDHLSLAYIYPTMGYMGDRYVSVCILVGGILAASRYQKCAGALLGMTFLKPHILLVY
jgi:hypothetical protein